MISLNSLLQISDGKLAQKRAPTHTTAPCAEERRAGLVIPALLGGLAFLAQHWGQTGLITNSSRASIPKLPMDKHCLTINVMLCCNYIEFKNRISDPEQTRWEAEAAEEQPRPRAPKALQAALQYQERSLCFYHSQNQHFSHTAC